MRDFLVTHEQLILRLSKLCARKSRGFVDPNDVAHDVCVSLLRLHDKGLLDPNRIERPEAYLRVVVRRAVRAAWLRARPRELTVGDELERVAYDEAFAHADAARSEDRLLARLDHRKTLAVLKARLRPRDALALSLFAEAGLSISELASELGLSVNNVYQVRHRLLSAAKEQRLIPDRAVVAAAQTGASRNELESSTSSTLGSTGSIAATHKAS